MKKFFRGLSDHERAQLKAEADFWEQQACYWKAKYENAKKYIEDIQDDIYSYDDND